MESENKSQNFYENIIEEMYKKHPKPLDDHDMSQLDECISFVASRIEGVDRSVEEIAIKIRKLFVVS